MDTIYEIGLICEAEEDYKEGLRYYQRCENGGQIEALYRLGRLHYKSLGTAKNNAEVKNISNFPWKRREMQNLSVG
jgi:TPR repeat protein